VNVTSAPNLDILEIAMGDFDDRGFNRNIHIEMPDLRQLQRRMVLCDLLRDACRRQSDAAGNGDFCPEL
jgi:hypothetical protein